MVTSSPSAASDRTLSPVYFLTPDITQAFTAVILQRHRDVGTFRALYWNRLGFRGAGIYYCLGYLPCSPLVGVADRVFERLVSNYERGGVGAGEVYVKGWAAHGF
jgi:hypothetical protein